MPTAAMPVAVRRRYRSSSLLRSWTMQTLRLAASAAVTVLLLALCAVLAEPAFDLPAVNTRGGIGAGGLPQFTVVAGAVLVPVMFVHDLILFRRTSGAAAAKAEGSAKARRMIVLGAVIFVLLAAYVFAWRLLSFLPASILFTAVLCAILLPKAARTRRAYAIAAVFSILFCTGVWALFVHVLAVPLR
jgi:hypothetical protein